MKLKSSRKAETQNRLTKTIDLYNMKFPLVGVITDHVM